MKKLNKITLKSISTVAIVFAGIQLSPLIIPSSQNKILAFLIPMIVLILAIFLQNLEDNKD